MILGYVGAGGLGQQIQIAISLFLQHRLLTLIIAIYLIVTVVDYLSAFLRSRLISLQTCTASSGVVCTAFMMYAGL